MDCSKCIWPNPDTCKVCKQDEKKEVDSDRQAELDELGNRAPTDGYWYEA